MDTTSKSNAEKSFPWGHVIGATLLGATLLLMLHTEGNVIRTELLTLLLFAVPPLYLAIRFRDRTAGGASSPQRPVLIAGLILSLFMLASLCSSVVYHYDYFFIEWVRLPLQTPEMFSIGIMQFILMALLLLPFTLKPLDSKPALFRATLLAIQLICLYQFWAFTQGELVYRDDHPSFVFRLWEFSSTFPHLLSYNPYWNAGAVGHFGTSSGISIIAAPFLPLLKVFEPHLIYTPILAFTFIVFMPWLGVAGVRIAGGDRTSSYVAGILTLAVSRFFFKWLLHFGTIAASISVAFAIVVGACLYRIFVLERTEWWVAIVLALSTYGLLAWPPGAIVLGAFSPTLLIHCRKLNVRKLGLLALSALLFLLLYWKILYIVFFSSETFEKHFVGVIQNEEAKQHFVFSMDILGRGFRHLCSRFMEANPILLFLGVAGVFFHPSRTLRRWYAPVIVVMIIITGWGRYYFPDLQLRRMAIPLMFIAVVPAATWIGAIMQARGTAFATARAMIISLLFLCGLNAAQIYANKGVAPYQVLAPELKDLVSWIKSNTPEDARVLFAGATKHKFGRGHVAALPLLTKREMMACDYYAFSPRSVEYDYPPRAFRTQENGMFEFMKLYNVSHIISYRDNYNEKFDERPDQFRAVHTIDEKGIRVYEVLHKGTLFEKGSGSVDAHFNRFEIELDQDYEEVILRYTWDNRLNTLGNAELFPYEAHEHATLIGIRPNGERSITIAFDHWL